VPGGAKASAGSGGVENGYTVSWVYLTTTSSVDGQARKSLEHDRLHTLGTKQTGAPSAGNPHAGCDVAGAGNGFTVRLLRHSQRKRGATARLDLRNTAPVLDPTGQGPGILSGPQRRDTRTLRRL
jgi:hypothetical protein